MIILEPNKPREYKAGEVLHLKVISMRRSSPGRWWLQCDDITPLQGAEPTGYGCHVCGIIEEAKPDGSLPEGWTEKKYEEGSGFLCLTCQGAAVCRICGCTDEDACETDQGPCYWAEPNLCSACALKLVRDSNQKEQ